MAKLLKFDEIKKQGRGYSLKAKAKSAEVWIYDEIGEYWGEGIGAKQFVKDLQALGKVNSLDVHINSPGGQVFDGIAIYNALKQHEAKKTVYIDGLAASIASVIAMAGDEINIADNAVMMIHRAWGLGIGNAADMRDLADQLEKLDGSIARAYARTGKGDEEIMELMEAETWMNAEEALEMGFADSITGAQEIAAKFDLNKYKYRNAPEAPASDKIYPPASLRSKLAHMSLEAQKIRAQRAKAAGGHQPPVGIRSKLAHMHRKAWQIASDNRLR